MGFLRLSQVADKTEYRMAVSVGLMRIALVRFDSSRTIFFPTFYLMQRERNRYSPFFSKGNPLEVPL